MRCGWYQQTTPRSDARAGSKAIEKYFKEATTDGIVVVLMLQMSSYVPAVASPC
ncbi:hypothetical protein F511_44430 [Dorcoceras hygrometricum]|uniref:Uncharacterized protein n=1 Tax=Dorcoceras hygrometricum TaxID=472368 RepID=A0A2Z6ZYF4_9LAMI|nr:hypothetical protein F511_44430 [Dorcoceras hygrometricum]